VEPPRDGGADTPSDRFAERFVPRGLELVCVGDAPGAAGPSGAAPVVDRTAPRGRRDPEPPVVGRVGGRSGPWITAPPKLAPRGERRRMATNATV
jgi:hypothetical protein